MRNCYRQMVYIKNLFFAYEKTERTILQDISLHVRADSYLSILGENGSGKSTLVKLILGLLKPISGSINCRAKHIGYVPQTKTHLSNAPITVFELLNSYRRILKIPNRDSIKAALEQTGMKRAMHVLVGNLSGGELQRVLIARSLIGNPDLIILDEPSTGVDIDGQRALYDLIFNMNREQQKTIIAVEHNLSAALHNSSEIFHLHKGFGHICNPKQYAQEFLGKTGLAYLHDVND